MVTIVVLRVLKRLKYLAKKSKQRFYMLREWVET
jgi:hypothetical protein